MAREQRVSEAFLELADTLQPEFDIAEFLHRLARSAVDLLGADGARVILADNHDRLKVVATTSTTAAPTAPAPGDGAPGDGVTSAGTTSKHAVSESVTSGVASSAGASSAVVAPVAATPPRARPASTAGPAPAASTVDELGDPHQTGGPGREAYRCGGPVACHDLAADPQQFAEFADRAHAAGFSATHAWPLRHRKQVIGAIEVYRSSPGTYPEPDMRMVETLTRLATISLLRERRQQHADTLAAQLQKALDSRLVIEQAKGILAERTRLGVDQAFVLLRGHARRHQMRLAALAAQVIDGTVDASLLAAGEHSVPRRPRHGAPPGRGSGVPRRRAPGA